MQYLPRDLHITAIHIYAVRPEYCHEHHLWEKLLPNTRENEYVDPRGDGRRRPSRTSGTKPYEEPFIQGLDIINNKKFQATSPMAVIQYCYDDTEDNDVVQYRIPQRSKTIDDAVMNHRTYLKKPLMMPMVIQSHLAEYKPRFRIGVLHDQSIRNLTDITGWRTWSLTEDTGHVGLDISWLRGAKTVKRYENDESLRRHSSVSEAIIMNLSRDPVVMRSTEGRSAGFMIPIADAPEKIPELSKSAAKRARKKERMGGAENYRSAITSPAKLAGFIRHAHQSTVKLPVDYYGSSNGMGMWTLPDFATLSPETEFHLVDTINETERQELNVITEQRMEIHKETAKDVIQEATHEVKRHARQLGMLITATEASTGQEPVLAVPKDLASDNIPHLDEWTWTHGNILNHFDD